VKVKRENSPRTNQESNRINQRICQLGIKGALFAARMKQFVAVTTKKSHALGVRSHEKFARTDENIVHEFLLDELPPAAKLNAMKRRREKESLKSGNERLKE
jgi:hypothetical protein